MCLATSAALQALQKAGAKPVQPSADQAHTAESGNPPSAVKQENGAAGHGTAAAPAAAPAAAAALPPSGPSPVMPQQWTPPGAAATPTSFLDILNAEITSPEQADPAWQVPAAALQQPLAGSAGPAVQGLPLPPGAAQQVQAAGMGSGGMSASSTAMSTAPSGGGGGANYALIHSAQVVLDGKVTGSGPLLLGVGQASGWKGAGWGVHMQARVWARPCMQGRELCQALPSSPGCTQHAKRARHAHPVCLSRRCWAWCRTRPRCACWPGRRSCAW